MKAVYNLQARRKNDILKSTARKPGSPMLEAVLKLNIIHLIVTCCDCAAILALLREARGRTLPPVQLFDAVPFALAAAPLLLAMGAPETRVPRLWLAGLVAGMVLGAVRGSFLKFQLDRMYSRLRLPNGRDWLWASCVMAFCTLVAFGAGLANAPDPVLEVGAAGMVAACAGYLTGRATTLRRRSLSAPHHTLHHLLP